MAAARSYLDVLSPPQRWSGETRHGEWRSGAPSCPDLVAFFSQKRESTCGRDLSHIRGLYMRAHFWQWRTSIEISNNFPRPLIYLNYTRKTLDEPTQRRRSHLLKRLSFHRKMLSRRLYHAALPVRAARASSAALRRSSSGEG
eukprot:scaffold1294_cov244-Pinguiococcus_pyrenoidosus.AAC.1